jgi:hypothetical protein
VSIAYYGEGYYGESYYGSVGLLLPLEELLLPLELDLRRNEPPGLFPDNQDSVWGQLRFVIGNQLQFISDLLELVWQNMSPTTAAEDALPLWEAMLDMPVPPAGTPASARTAGILARLEQGPFTRTRRRRIVERFIEATFGAATVLTLDGIPITPAGITLYSGEFDFTGLYNIVENVEAFTYDIRILNTMVVNTAGLTRELDRITPAGISFTVTYTPTP